MCMTSRPNDDHVPQMCHFARVGTSSAYATVSVITFSFHEVCCAYEMVHRVLDAESLHVKGDMIECARDVRPRKHWRLWVMSSKCAPSDLGTIMIDEVKKRVE